MKKQMWKFFVLIFLAIGCKSDSADPQKLSNQDKENGEPPSSGPWISEASIYEVDVYNFNEAGSINTFSDHIPRIKNMGFNVISFTPVFVSDPNDVFAVRDYSAVDPKLGTTQDFINLIDKIHAYKMKVLLQFPIDRTSTAHSWISGNPTYYKKNEKVAELNYESNQVHAAMTNEIMFWLKDRKIDGVVLSSEFRPDSAFIRLLAHRMAQENPQALLVSNGYEELESIDAQLTTAFHDSSLQECLDDVAAGKRSTSDLKKLISKNNQLKALPIHYTSNKMVNARRGSAVERLGGSRLAAAALLYTLNGVPLVFNGQEEPLARSLSLNTKDEIGFTQYKTMAFYQELNRQKRRNPSLWANLSNVPLQDLTNHEFVLAFKRSAGNQTMYAVFNLSDQIQKLTLSEPVHDAYQWFEGKRISIAEGEQVILEPWKFIIAVAGDQPKTRKS